VESVSTHSGLGRKEQGAGVKGDPHGISICDVELEPPAVATRNDRATSTAKAVTGMVARYAQLRFR
jgi:hypothetical protein